MADGNTTAVIKEFDYVDAAQIGMRGDFYLELGVTKGSVGAEEMVDYARQIGAWGRAALSFARHRGSTEEDHPDALDNALAAAEFLLQLSAGMEQAAMGMASGAEGVRHG